MTRAEDAGADGLELNFGCPHGMSERGMGSAVGQVPEYAQMITEWVKEKARTPVLVKLTPNITRYSHGGAGGEARRSGWVVGDQHDQFDYRDRSGHVCAAAECGWEELARRLLRAGGEADRAEHGAADFGGSRRAALPLSGIGGIGTWRDAAEFLLLGCGTVQVCTAVMHYGYRIVEDMAEGLDNWMREKGFKTLEDFRGLSLRIA